MAYHIVQCISWYWPIESGAERQARRQAVELVRRGHRVTVLTRFHPDRPEVEEIDGVHVKRWIRPREVGPVFGLSFLWTLRRALCRVAPTADIVHCHQALWEAAAAGWARRQISIPVVVQPAASGPYGEYHIWRRTRGRRLLRRWIHRCDHFVAISREIEQELIDWGVAPDRITRLASGVDTEQFSPGKSPVEHELPPRPRVLFVGRLHPQKELPTLLRAWREVARSMPGTLVVVGTGPEEASLRALSNELGIGDRVVWVGAVEDVVSYYRAGDLFVLPSASEGMSNALLEAMATGLAPVVSRIGGNTDLVEDGRTGVVVEPGSSDSLARALERLLADRPLRERLGRAAREHILRGYSLQAVVDRYEALFARVIERSRSGTRT